MKTSLFFKIFGGCFIIIVGLSLLTAFFSFQSIRSTYIHLYTENLRNLAVTARHEITSLLAHSTIKELDTYIKGLQPEIQTRITVIHNDGTVIADSKKDPRTMENHKIRPEVLEALSGTFGTSRRMSVSVEEEMLYAAIPLEKDGKIIGVIRMSVFLKEINSLLGGLRTKIFWIALIMTIFALLVAANLSRRVSKPVRKLVDAAQNLSRGDFETRIFLKEEDELKILADSFNTMSSRMYDMFLHISNQNEELNSIISSIRESLVVFDTDGKIKLWNESFQALTSQAMLEGKFYWEVLRAPEFGELMQDIEKNRQIVTGELPLNNRIYQCSLSALRTNNEIVALFHDITDIKHLEKMKRDFIANVSHELRTPLTAIKGFVETLEEEEQIENTRYMEIIKRNTDRLMNIVSDLLLLSEMENKETFLEREEVSLQSLVPDCARIFEHRMQEKGLKMAFSVAEDVPPIEADSFKLEQMFLNLIDNAVKYSEKGTITLSVFAETRNVVITVQDEGIGIPADRLQRIFERFYVVDKSRSKKQGGTGLGLSIVKHIVMLHKGSISVESAPGRGTRFSVILPIKRLS